MTHADILKLSDDDMIEVANNVLASPDAKKGDKEVAMLYICTDKYYADLLKEGFATMWARYA